MDRSLLKRILRREQIAGPKYAIFCPSMLGAAAEAMYEHNMCEHPFCVFRMCNSGQT